MQTSKSSRPADTVFVSDVNSFKKRTPRVAEPLFGTDGIRGKVGSRLTASLALEIGYWTGQVLQTQVSLAKLVIVGQDSRNSSDMLAAALSAGLTSAGLEVWSLGLCSTPAVAYLTSILGAVGGIMISASHNPPEDNGIKFFGADGTKLSQSLQVQIEQCLQGEQSSEVEGTLRCGHQYVRPELLEQYAIALQTSLPAQIDLSRMRIVLDLAWGSSVYLAPQAFKAIGATVICLHDQPDGDRINVHCGSTHLAPLQAAVQQHDADVGFAFDGDADRLMAIDSQGRVVDGDHILYLWGQQLRQAGQLPQNTLVSTVMSNLGFERAWQQSGGQLIRTAVGDQHVHAEMMRLGAMLGGEQSGHILCPHYSVSGDGLLTALHLAALVKQSGRSLAQLRDQSFQSYPQLLKNVSVVDRDRRLNWKENESLLQVLAEAEQALCDQGRVLVRASGTEPILRIMVEAADTKLTEYWAENLTQTFSRTLLN
ncbi:MAG: phosphoglucosamine mutase [Leptolyngbyaceae cyanobacterium CSU_1_4]|nr:phosphoglucosamine mutase [Leptolyngbyaceae cyanobacterium CSU_1_4]